MEKYRNQLQNHWIEKIEMTYDTLKQNLFNRECNFVNSTKSRDYNSVFELFKNDFRPLLRNYKFKGVDTIKLLFVAWRHHSWERGREWVYLGARAGG